MARVNFREYQKALDVYSSTYLAKARSSALVVINREERHMRMILEQEAIMSDPASAMAWAYEARSMAIEERAVISRELLKRRKKNKCQKWQ